MHPVRRALREPRLHLITPVAGLLIVAWTVIYGALALGGHFVLRTNAYDLSVFDYALRNAGRGGVGDVPFMGHSLFAHHFMPTLFVLWPAYQIAASPVLLIVVQILAIAGAALLLRRLLPADLPLLPAIAIVAAFLFGRRSHSAAVSLFYLESLEPLLVFATLLAWRANRMGLAAIAGLLALGCKEDMALYGAAFGLLVFLQQSRRRGAIVIGASLIWFAAAVGLAVPAARRADGLPPVSPFVDLPLAAASAVTTDDAGAGDGVAARLAPLVSGRTLQSIVILTASAGFLCWFAPAWLLVALPGFLATLLRHDEAASGGLIGHYLFPILPWIFAAAAAGAGRLQRSRPTLLAALSVLLLAGTVADSPLWRTRGIGSADERQAAAAIRRALRAIPPDAPVLAMPNLVPHLPHRAQVWTVGSDLAEAAEAGPVRVVALSTAGDLWPLDEAAVRAEVQRFAADPRFKRLLDGPLHLFVRVERVPALARRD